MSTTTTNHDNDEESEEEQPKPQPKPRLSDKERTLTRLKQLKAEGLVFQSYDGNAEPDYTILGAKGGGLIQRGSFGRR